MEANAPIYGCTVLYHTSLREQYVYKHAARLSLLRDVQVQSVRGIRCVVGRHRSGKIRAGILRHRAVMCDRCPSPPALTALGLQKVLLREAPAIAPGYKSSPRADHSTDTDTE